MGLCGRERFEECRQLDLLYIPYIPYILLPYLTIFPHYYYLQSLRTHSSTPKYLNPFVAFPEARRTGVAWHVGDSASLSGGGWQHQRQELPAPLQSLSQFRCSSSALGSERAITVKHVSQSVGERAWTPDPPNCETA